MRKRGHEFDIQQGSVYERVWLEEKKGNNIVNLDQKVNN